MEMGRVVQEVEAPAPVDVPAQEPRGPQATPARPGAVAAEEPAVDRRTATRTATAVGAPGGR